MKRQIKFRVWDIEKKCFIPDYVWALLVNNQAFGVMMIDWENYREGEYFYDNAQILMQFTGLQDINGKDIYEGDIIRYTWTKQLYEVKSGFVKKYAYTGWYAENYYIEKTLNLFNGADIEIIGNIYENPELLKTTENE